MNILDPQAVKVIIDDDGNASLYLQTARTDPDNPNAQRLEYWIVALESSEPFSPDPTPL